MTPLLAEYCNAVRFCWFGIAHVPNHNKFTLFSEQVKELVQNILAPIRDFCL